jgi:hypothetical protein
VAQTLWFDSRRRSVALCCMLMRHRPNGRIDMEL